MARDQACGNKYKHASLAGAQKHALDIPKRRGKYIAVYRCVYCNYWHVGNRPERAALRRAALSRLDK